MTLNSLGAHTKGGLITGTQNTKEGTSNDLDNLISDSLHNPTDFVTTAGGTLNLNTPAPNLDQYLESGLIRLTGTPGAPYTIILPDGTKKTSFQNVSGQTCTFNTVTGATPTRPLVDAAGFTIQVRGIEIDIVSDNSAATGALKADGTVAASGSFNWADKELKSAKLIDYSETVDTPTIAGTTTLDLELGNVFEVELDQSTTFVFDKPPITGVAGSFTLILKQDVTGGFVTIWPGAVIWSKGIPPVLTTTPSAIDIISFFTIDAGTTWYGFLGGLTFT